MTKVNLFRSDDEDETELLKSETELLSESELLSETEDDFNLIVAYIRFPMMSPGQLANLLLFKQISKSCTDLLVSSNTLNRVERPSMVQGGRRALGPWV